MKIVTRSVTVALLVATLACNAMADGRRGHSSHGQHRNYQGRGHDAGWVAPLLFLGLAGAVLGAAASQPSVAQPIYVQPPVTYVQPVPQYVAPAYIAPPAVAQVPPLQPANAWYFCKSVGQYYPYTQYCPEGWQLVSPTPQ